MKYLDKALAQEIVDRTMKIIKRNINVMDNKGVIIGSGDKSRIDSVHEGAIRIIEGQAEFEIGDTEAVRLYGVKAGINLPINFNNQVVGVIGITGPPKDIRSSGELVKMAAEMILQQAVLIDQMQWDERLKEELISQLLYGTEKLNSLYFERVSRLGIDLEIPRVAVIVTVDDRAKVFKAIRDKLGKDDLYVMQPDHLVLLKKVDSDLGSAKVVKEMEKWAASLENNQELRCTFTIGNYHPTLGGISKSYREALLTSRVGEKLTPSKTIYFYEDYKLPVFLARAKESGIDEEIGPYFQQLKQQDKKGELVETLLDYITESGDTNAITGKLFIHRNTLRYRLDRITEITGRDPRKVKDLLELYLSIIQEQIK
jgi:carbohydrate diacid regulator